VTTPEAVGFARRLLSADLAAAQVRESMADDAVLVLSELASNALLHGHPRSCGHVEVACASTTTSCASP
jgi:anti-sigma regulatory factor (Ser/Thr protein kinase)